MAKSSSASPDKFKVKRKPKVNAEVPDQAPEKVKESEKTSSPAPEVFKIKKKAKQMAEIPEEPKKHDALSPDDNLPQLTPQYSESGFGGMAAGVIDHEHRMGAMQNSELLEKTQALQEEFESLFKEMKKNREEKDPDSWYTAMNDYNYGDNATQQHNSPTKRLIDQKNVQVTHKGILKSSID